MLVRIEPLLSFIAAPQGFGSIGATTILTQGGIDSAVIGPWTSWSSSCAGILGNAADRAAMAAFFNFVLLGIHASF